uniref:sphingomyelin phosphodiesterase n=1 Tax=Strigamia maritima TaxID=126957 RepID=T1J5F8_STRMM
MKMELQLRVFTLNCWGIPGISADRKARIVAIATELARGGYDLVALQEVWSYSDYETIARKVFPSMRYSYYFRSGCLGSGLCIFSKGRIIDALFQTWPLNGYAHRIQHGDWFGGKGVGLARIFYQGIFINFYTAHLHAVYNHNNDEYLSHRVCQAFEFSQFVSSTSSNCDVVIVAGDFNAEIVDVPYRLICYNANLLDTFKQCEKKDEGNGATNETKRNSYTPSSILKENPYGRRIDYILYNYHNGSEVKVLASSLPLDKIPELGLSFSDHEAVSATLNITKSAGVKKWR